MAQPLKYALILLPIVTVKTKPVTCGPARVRVVAVTGCDGSGKSTLVAGLFARLRSDGPTQLLYLGNSSGRIAMWVQGLPLVGAPLARYLDGKAAHVHEPRSKGTGLVPALAIYLLSRWRLHRFRRMLALCRRGVLVITDRYPQAEAAGFHFDGPELAGKQARGWLVARLARREQQLYEWMAAHVPVLVIRLDVDADTAHARKPDHDLSTLRKKVAVLPQLTFNGAQVLDIDARQPVGQILDTAVRAARAATSTATVAG